ncbi:hypothetical protein RFI_36271, partial [Reticulomyxa filosa]
NVDVLLAWINSFLVVNVKTIKEMKTGALYCNLFAVFYPDHIQMTKVDFICKKERNIKKNWEILQEAFQNVMIHRDIPINELIQGHENEHLKLLQWAYDYFHSKKMICNAVDARSNSNGGRNFHQQSENNDGESTVPQDTFVEVPEELNSSQKDAKINEDDDSKNNDTNSVPYDPVEHLKKFSSALNQRHEKAEDELNCLRRERTLHLRTFTEIAKICNGYHDQNLPLVKQINQVAYYIFAFFFQISFYIGKDVHHIKN